MKRLAKAALLVRLVEALRRNGSWCGETHVQKSIYLLQSVLGVPLGFDYILYKHGPFSFDLRDELTSLQADGVLELQPQPIPYGPKLSATTGGVDLAGRFPKTVAEYQEDIEQVAGIIGNRGVNELERLATAVFVTQRDPQHSARQRAKAIVGLKPHISVPDADAAIAEADDLLGRT